MIIIHFLLVIFLFILFSLTYLFIYYLFLFIYLFIFLPFPNLFTCLSIHSIYLTSRISCCCKETYQLSYKIREQRNEQEGFFFFLGGEHVLESW